MICPKCKSKLRKVDIEISDNENYKCINCKNKWLIVNCGVDIN